MCATSAINKSERLKMKAPRRKAVGPARAGPVRITEMAANLQPSERSGQMVVHRGSSGRRQFEQDRDKMAPKSTEHFTSHSVRTLCAIFSFTYRTLRSESGLWFLQFLADLTL